MRPTTSTAGLTWLIFKKDVRATRYPLALLAVIMGTFLYLVFPPPDHVTQISIISPLLLFIGITGMGLLVVQLILSDPAGREMQFLSTRPVPGTAIGLAKLIFMIVFVVLPYLAYLDISLANVGIPLSPSDHLLFLTERLITGGAYLLAIVTLSAFLRNGLAIVGVMVAFFLAYVIFLSWGQWAPYHWPSFDEERLKQFCVLLSSAVFLVSTLLILGWRYRTRELRGPLIGVAASCGLSYLALFCPYNFASFLQDQSGNASLMTPEQLSQIRMTLFSGMYHDPDSNSDESARTLTGAEGSNHVRFVNLGGLARFDGIAAPYFVQTVGYHAVVTLRSGKSFTSDYADFDAHGGVGGLQPWMMARMASGGQLSATDKKITLYLDLMTYVPDRIASDDLTDATVRGVITLDVHREFIAGRIPLRTGAVLNRRRWRYEVESTDLSDRQVSYRLRIPRVPITLRGDLVNWNTPETLQWLPVYRPKELALQPRSNGFNGSDIGPVAEVIHANGQYEWPPQGTYPNFKPSPKNWSSQVELVFFGSELCGQIQLPYEIDHVDLRYRF